MEYLSKAAQETDPTCRVILSQAAAETAVKHVLSRIKPEFQQRDQSLEALFGEAGVPARELAELGSVPKLRNKLIHDVGPQADSEIAELSWNVVQRALTHLFSLDQRFEFLVPVVKNLRVGSADPDDYHLWWSGAEEEPPAWFEELRPSHHLLKAIEEQLPPGFAVEDVGRRDGDEWTLEVNWMVDAQAAVNEWFGPDGRLQQRLETEENEAYGSGSAAFLMSSSQLEAQRAISPERVIELSGLEVDLERWDYRQKKLAEASEAVQRFLATKGAGRRADPS